MKKTLDIAPDLSLPIDYITGSAGIFATKGMGKTFLAQVLAEEMLDRGQQIVVIDPTDAWFGLRAGVNGHPGYPIIVIGGDHADMQLEPESAEMLADAIISEGFSCIVCTDGLSDTQEIKFVRVLVDRLFRRIRDSIIHVFVDEADIFAPQKPFEVEDSRCIRAMAHLARRGRRKGLGSTFITQRPAELNAGVRGMCETMFVLGMGGHLDIEAIERWVRLRRKKTGDNVKVELQEEMIESLDTLAQGDAWVWAPRRKLHKRFRARAKHTFDSGATPKVGEKIRAPKVLAPVDLQRLGAAMSAAAERQQANDPKALKAKIAELVKERDQLARAASAPVPQKAAKTIERAVVKDAQIKRVEALLTTYQKLIEMMNGHADKARDALVADLARAESHAAKLVTEGDKLRSQLGLATMPIEALEASWSKGDPLHHAYMSHPPKGSAAPSKSQRGLPATEPPNRVVRGPQLTLPKVPSPPPDGAPALSKMERAMLIALAQHPAGLTRKQVLIFSSYRHSGSTTTAFARMLAEGLIENRSGALFIKPWGFTTLGEHDPLPVGEDLRASLLNGNDLSTMEKQILGATIEAYPQVIDRTAARGAYAHSGSTTTAFARLIAMNYVTKQRGGIRAAEELMS